MRKKYIENWIFVIISILLTSFQIGLYAKACKMPNFLHLNMILLYVALVMPFIIRKIKNRKLAMFLFAIYLLYFVMTFAGFLNLISDPLLNCEAALEITLEAAK
jgi:hypothetical protein